LECPLGRINQTLEVLDDILQSKAYASTVVGLGRRGVYEVIVA
jgi:hypothetical protein